MVSKGAMGQINIKDIKKISYNSWFCPKCESINQTGQELTEGSIIVCRVCFADYKVKEKV